MRRKQSLSTPLLGLLLSLLVFITTVLASAQPQPFLPAETPAPVQRRYHAGTPIDVLVPRQTTTATTGCISGTFSCATQGAAFASICCASGQACALDAQNSPACCPSGAVCTGTAPTSFRPPSTTPVSYVGNPFFSFPYIVTSFSNAAACSRAVSACSANYGACTRGLEGGAGGGATVVVGGSTTVGGAVGTTYATSSATSICSSLSSVACFGIQDSYCTAGSTGGITVGSANAAAARPTGFPCVGMVAAGVAAGFGLGVMGI